MGIEEWGRGFGWGLALEVDPKRRKLAHSAGKWEEEEDHRFCCWLAVKQSSAARQPQRDCGFPFLQIPIRIKDESAFFH
jgi:hypothetical protein